ncbi:DNA repair protein RadA [Thermodesulfobacteriota bacterium]
MASKKKTVFVCQNCGSKSFKWLGKCPDCGEFNSLFEEIAEEQIISSGDGFSKEAKAQPLNQITTQKEFRIKTNIVEFDRALGGGVVAGAATLIGGDPGIGKSTLLLQMTAGIEEDTAPILYVSGEESAFQIKKRAERLHVKRDNLYILTETSLENIINEIKRISPQIIIIDSIQTIYTLDLGSTAGTVSQIRECASRLIYVSKVTSIPVIFVGHITKSGEIAGPKVLEHMVDTVLYFEGDRGHPYRILRSVKNRFGSTNEIGVFEMGEEGLSDVINPSELFLSQRPLNAAGSVVVSSLEGTRPLLIELQALVTQSNLGMPRRTTIGVDHGRVSLLVAILEKKLGMHLMSQDIFLNAAGGVKVDEPAVDLGIVASIASSFLNKPVDPGVVIIGEVGLTGEVRGIRNMDGRISEAEKMGFTKCIVPINSKINKKGLKDIEIIQVKTIKDMFDSLF